MMALRPPKPTLRPGSIAGAVIPTAEILAMIAQIQRAGRPVTDDMIAAAERGHRP